MKTSLHLRWSSSPRQSRACERHPALARKVALRTLHRGACGDCLSYRLPGITRTAFVHVKLIPHPSCNVPVIISVDLGPISPLKHPQPIFMQRNPPSSKLTALSKS